MPQVKRPINITILKIKINGQVKTSQEKEETLKRNTVLEEMPGIITLIIKAMRDMATHRELPKATVTNGDHMSFTIKNTRNTNRNSTDSKMSTSDNKERHRNALGKKGADRKRLLKRR